MRLNPLTNDLPVSLLYLPGGTVLDYLLHHLSELPITKTALILQYHGDQIAGHLAERERRDLHLIPQYPPFTFLSALASAAPWVEGPTLVLHGNFYFARDLRYFVEAADPTRPTFLLAKEEQARQPSVRIGAYLLPPEVFYLAAQYLEGDTLGDLWQILMEQPIALATHPLQGWARSINTPSDLLMVNRFLLKKWHEVMHPPEAGVGYDALNFNWRSPEATVDEEVTNLFVTIGPRASVRNSRLYNSLVLPGVHLRDAKEQHAILAPSANSLLRLYVPATTVAMTDGAYQ